MIPEVLDLIDDSDINGKIHYPGQRKQNETMRSAAQEGKTLAEVNGYTDEKLRELYPATAGGQKRLRALVGMLFDLELPDHVSREDFIRLYKTPMRMA
jgi:hypothetical protein